MSDTYHVTYNDYKSKLQSLSDAMNEAEQYVQELDIECVVTTGKVHGVVKLVTFTDGCDNRVCTVRHSNFN